MKYKKAYDHIRELKTGDKFHLYEFDSDSNICLDFGVFEYHEGFSVVGSYLNLGDNKSMSMGNDIYFTKVTRTARKKVWI